MKTGKLNANSLRNYINNISSIKIYFNKKRKNHYIKTEINYGRL
jgi:hypothetical protein